MYLFIFLAFLLISNSFSISLSLSVFFLSLPQNTGCENITRFVKDNPSSHVYASSMLKILSLSSVFETRIKTIKKRLWLCRLSLPLLT